MPFSNKFILLLLIGIVPIFLGNLIGMAAVTFIIYNLILLTFLIIDYNITAAISELELERICDVKFSLGVDNKVDIRVRNNSKYSVLVNIKDDVPLFMDKKDEPLRVNVPGHSEAEVNYYVKPKKRGEYVFGDIYVKYNGRLGLCQKMGKYNKTAPYKVYPNLKDLTKNNISFIKKNIVLSGSKKIRLYGMGSEFESLREFNENDDFRKINWYASARANKLIANNYEPEKNQQIFVVIDSSRVMNSEIKYIKKLDYAINASLMLVDAALKRGDNSGLMVFDNEIRRFIKPAKGSVQFQLIADNLYNVRENIVSADYFMAMKHLSMNQKRRSLVCIFTELITADEAISLVKAIRMFLKQHLPLVITINDLRLAQICNKELEDENDIFDKAAAIKLIEDREEIKKIFKDNRIATIDVAPDKLSVEVVNKYINVKSMGIV